MKNVNQNSSAKSPLNQAAKEFAKLLGQELASRWRAEQQGRRAALPDPRTGEGTGESEAEA